MGDRIGDSLQVLTCAGHISADKRDRQVVGLLEVAVEDRGRRCVGLGEDHIRLGGDRLLHLRDVGRLPGGHVDRRQDRAAQLLERLDDRRDQRLGRDVGVEQQHRAAVALLVRVQRHRHSQLRVRGAVAEQERIGLVIAGGVAALELVDDLRVLENRLDCRDLLGLRSDDPRHAGGQQLLRGGHRISKVALGVLLAQLDLLAEHAARRVDRPLGYLRALEHGLTEAGQSPGEAGKHPVVARRVGGCTVRR